ncbi:MAG: serine O-acetyltransferase [Candidatus Gastranaerophilaceae bacterium]
MFDRAIFHIKDDIKTIYEKDPAANNILEVIFCYPGLHALLAHRFSHKLYKWKIPFIPRFISFIMRILTGIEIHPGAEIGERFFIDHGEGVVIGETTIIGNDVLIYQQVTLGGTGKDKGKRHPTLMDGVIVGAGAKVLGNITLGNHVRVGAGSVVVEDVPDFATVVGIPGRIVKQKYYDENGTLMHNRIPDPVKCKIQRMTYEIKEIQDKLGIKHENFEDFCDG